MQTMHIIIAKIPITENANPNSVSILYSHISQYSQKLIPAITDNIQIANIVLILLHTSVISQSFLTKSKIVRTSWQNTTTTSNISIINANATKIK